MRKTTLLTMIFSSMFAFLQAAPQIKRVEPLSWWTDMQCPLTLMFHGSDLKDAQVSIVRLNGKKVVKGECTGLVVRGQHNAENPNYLFVDMTVREAGTYRITLAKDKKRATWDYTIANRRAGSREREGFNSQDAMYLVMSDRFVDGDPNNNAPKNIAEKTDKSNVNGRFGGDIAGIVSQMDRLREMGITSIWATPMLLDNEVAWSYHGYACSDYYHIDPRMGSNEEYRQMVETAHSKGLKIVMDMVPNHCGAAHWWTNDKPYADWFSYPTFVRTNGAFSTNYDPNASAYDRKLNEGGWFDNPMPDMNLYNPDLLQYFKQWAIWWAEYANLDGFRVDTYPYIARDPAADWCKAIMNEYPNFNIVGECWTRPTSAVAYWQHKAGNKDGFDSNMPSVMDFPLEEAIRQAMEEKGTGWGEGLTRIYEVLSQDYLYGNVNNLLLFLSNHDMARFSDVVLEQNPRRVKLGMALIATMRGIPQLLYGEEYNMHSLNKENPADHSYLRAPLPLENLNDEQTDMFEYVRTLLTWRRDCKPVHFGRTMHFYSNDNTYAFFRYLDDEAVFVYINASEEDRKMPIDHYQEILGQYKPVGVDIITGEEFDLSQAQNVKPLSAIIIPLHK